MKNRHLLIGLLLGAILVLAIAAVPIANLVLQTDMNANGHSLINVISVLGTNGSPITGAGGGGVSNAVPTNAALPSINGGTIAVPTNYDAGGSAAAATNALKLIWNNSGGAFVGSQSGDIQMGNTNGGGGANILIDVPQVGPATVNGKLNGLDNGITNGTGQTIPAQATAAALGVVPTFIPVPTNWLYLASPPLGNDATARRGTSQAFATPTNLWAHLLPGDTIYAVPDGSFWDMDTVNQSNALYKVGWTLTNNTLIGGSTPAWTSTNTASFGVTNRLDMDSIFRFYGSNCAFYNVNIIGVTSTNLFTSSGSTTYPIAPIKGVSPTAITNGITVEGCNIWGDNDVIYQVGMNFTVVNGVFRNNHFASWGDTGNIQCSGRATNSFYWIENNVFSNLPALNGTAFSSSFVRGLQITSCGAFINNNKFYSMVSNSATITELALNGGNQQITLGPESFFDLNINGAQVPLNVSFGLLAVVDSTVYCPVDFLPIDSTGFTSGYFAMQQPLRGATTNIQFTDTSVIPVLTNTLYFTNGVLRATTSP